MKKILVLFAFLLSATLFSQIQITGPDDIVDPFDPIGTTPSTGDGEVGNTQGNLSVSATGGAVYNVPIQLPPGIKDIAPSISLNYNSQSGDGYAGYGWHIGGLSKISKVPSNLYHDGVIDPVSFDGLKRFSFDGQRLILKTGVYGIPGSTYETEQFSNVKISYLSNGYGIGHNRYFKVEYPDGSIAYYGYVEGGQNNISYLEFPITKWENPQGLKITYEYYTYASGFVKEYSALIKSIKYGNDSNQGLNSIEFVYKEKNKQDVYYFLEVEQKRNKVLSAIKITGNGVPFKNYYLTHDLTSSGNERLKSIQEKTGDNSKSLKPLTFNYKVNQSSYNQEISYSHRGGYLPNKILGDFTGDDEIEGHQYKQLYRLNPDYSVTKTSPVNGNLSSLGRPISTIPLTFLNADLKVSNKMGFCDYFFGFDALDLDKSLKIYSYNKDNNSYEFEYEKVISHLYGTENQEDYFGVYSEIYETGTNGYPIGQNSRGGFFSDFNGDRLTDFVTFKIEGGNLLLKFIDLDRRLTANYNFDTPIINIGATYLGESSFNHSGTTKVLQGDYDGDGRSDLIVFRGSPYNKIEVYSLNNNLFEKKIDINYNLPGDIFNSGKYPIVLGDYNGDSKTDFLMTWEKKIIYSQGSISHYASELLPNTFVTPNPTKRTAYLSWDMNNDGKSDIVRLESLYETKRIKKCSVCAEMNWVKSGIRINYYEKQGTWKVYNFEKITQDYINNSVPDDPSDDNKFAPLLPTLLKENTNQQNLSLLGISGYRGQTDNFGQEDYLGVTSYFNFQRHSNDQTLLTSVDEGNGVINEIIYDNLKDGNGTYTTSNDLLEYPYFNLLNDKEYKVVSEIRHFYSGSPIKKKQFKYYGAVYDIAGRGISGFQATTSTNWFIDISGIISTVNKYDFTKNGANTETFSKVGLVEPNYNLLSTDSYVSRSLVTYNNEDTAYINPLLPNKVFKLFKTKTESFNGLENTSSLTSITYNGNNNPLSTTTSIKNGTTTEQKTVTTYGYDAPLSSPYLLDRLNSKTITTTLLSSGDVSSTEELYTYDVNLLKTIKKRSTNSGLTSDYITETNIYDAYGNITQKNIATPGLADRVTKFEYDTATHRFITKKTGIDGLVTEYTYNQSTGLITSELLPSNLNYPLKTTYNYDLWGKKIEEIDYLGKKKTFKYGYSSDGVLINISGDDGSVTEINHDKLGRIIHEATKTIEGLWSVVATTYNINDQPIKVTQPYLEGGNFNAWNEMEYDLYGRLTKVNQLKTGSSTGKVITYGYTGLTTTEHDGQKTKTTVKNALGNVVSLEETPGVQIQYEYFANGGLKATHTSGATTAITQDAWGRRKSLDDPSAGIHNYSYSAFGELLSEEIVGRGITEYDLDDYGKVLEKRIKEGTNLVTKNTYTYDSTTKQLKQIRFDDYTNASFTIYNYGYDNFKRLNFKDESGLQAYYQQAIQYDAFGRRENELYTAINTSDLKRSDKWVKNVYKNGSLWKIHDMPSFGTLGAVLWQANTVNPSGQITEALLGNGIKLTKTYDNQGLPAKIKYDKSSLNVLTLDTEFDPIYGNLKKRSTNLFGAWTEDLTYDALDRLTSWKDGTGVQNQLYNDNGSIASNKVGAYAYTINQKPYQVSTITPVVPSATYDYYANRMQNIAYNVSNNPISIQELNAENIDFEYNAFDNRATMYYGGLQPLKTNRPYRKCYSADGTMEIKRNITNNTVEFVTYIGGDAYTAPVVLKSDGATKEFLYLHRDYQGTIVGVSNSTGVLVEKRWFDVWGSLIRYANSSGVSTVPTVSTAMLLDRGYTGHEHLLGVNIINMNGRIYDDKLHRFLQPDNNIQDPYNTQNFNRYGYVMNNPTKYTDPSGENIWGYIFGAIFSSYASGVQASGGELNPIKWDSTGWTNAGLGAVSYAASKGATYYSENYIYGNQKNNLGVENSFSTNNIENYNHIQYNHEAFSFAIVTTGVLVGDDVTVIGAVDDVLIPFVWAGAAAYWTVQNIPAIVGSVVGAYEYVENSLDPKGFKYVTYTKTNAEGLVYVGRSSGYGTPEQIVKNRDYKHHMNKQGYGPATLSTVIPATIDGGYGKRFLDSAYWGIRGSEQLQIDAYRELGISGNDRNGISTSNGKRSKYIEWARTLFEF